ncbi:MAG: dephospho-CoA kinase [Candidatus Omnitrophica bacterium]|nr:dephospho-CoA kinase [Candidatus Omnitrophota bacterium]
MKRKCFVVGITGGFHTGKSTVLGFFKKWGAYTLSCDEIARRSLAKGTRTYRAIARRFGESVLTKSRAIDRRKLAGVIFGNRKERIKLERIIHPYVFREIRRRLKKRCGIAAIEVPLLFETGFEKRCDSTVSVFCGRGKQIKRVSRGDSFSKDELKRRIRHQIPLSEKLRLSDFVIDNGKTLARTRREARKVWLKIKENYNKRG